MLGSDEDTALPAALGAGPAATGINESVDRTITKHTPTGNAKLVIENLCLLSDISGSVRTFIRFLTKRPGDGEAWRGTERPCDVLRVISRYGILVAYHGPP